MRALTHWLGVLLGLLPGAAGLAQESDAQDQAASPRAQYQALLDACRNDSGSFRRATTDAERRAAVEQWGRYARRFVDLAERHAATPIALDAAREAIDALNSADSLTLLTWDMNQSAFPERGEDDPVGRAVALLQRDHMRSEALGLVCVRMAYGLRPEYEAFLRAVVTESPHAEVQGLACLALAQFLNGRLLRLDVAAGRPELAERFAALLGEECFARLQGPARVRAGLEVEAWFEKAAREYADVEHPYAGKVGARARSELFERRHLTVGKLAPEIEGVDQSGEPLRLSDQRGKVVLLDFWHEY